MYNRYVPSEDGTYRRQVVEERKPVSSKPACPPPQKPAPVKSPARKNSLLSGMDTADLLLLLILLLLMNDSGSDNTSLLLTIALYFLLQ